MSKAISTEAILTSVRTRADKSLGLSFSSPELTPDEQLAFLQIKGRNLKMILQAMDEPVDTLVTVASDLQQKTPSQRLRGVLYKQFQQSGATNTDFQGWYNAAMERILTAEKAKLEPSPF